MEQTHTINPLNIFWQSPDVRSHLTNAGTELMAAVLTGLTELRSAAAAQDLPAQYPYLLSAFQTVQSALGGLINRATSANDDLADVTVIWSESADDFDTPAPRKKPRAKKSSTTKKSAPRRAARKTARR